MKEWFDEWIGWEDLGILATCAGIVWGMPLGLTVIITILEGFLK